MSAPHLANHFARGKDEASGPMTVNRKLPPILINTSLQRGVAGAPWNFNRFNGLPPVLDKWAISAEQLASCNLQLQRTWREFQFDQFRSSGYYLHVNCNLNLLLSKALLLSGAAVGF